MLAARARTTARRHLNVGLEDGDLRFSRFGKNGDRQRGGVDPPALLGVGDVLPAVATGFSREKVVGAFAGDAEDLEARSFFDEFKVKDASGRRGARR